MLQKDKEFELKRYLLEHVPLIVIGITEGTYTSRYQQEKQGIEIDEDYDKAFEEYLFVVKWCPPSILGRRGTSPKNTNF
jgi:hypothetical protein